MSATNTTNKTQLGSMARQGRNSLNAGGAAKAGSASGKAGSKDGMKLRLSKENRVNWPLTALTAVLSLTVLVPLYFAFVSSLKDNASIGGLELPSIWNWSNYAQAWDLVNYPRAVWNTLIITVAATVLTLLTNTFVAYAVARNMDRPFFKFMYYFFVAAMFVPFTVIMLPLAHEMGWLGLDNQVGLILLYIVLGLGTNLFIGIGFIRSIPVSLEEAARIDGASTWRVFWTIIFPLMGPINATIAVMTVLWVWNDFMLPLIILTDQSAATLQLSQYVFSSQFTTNYPVAFASYLMAMAPVLVVYILAQRWVVSGVMRGAVK
ncbi:ABC transporter permease [Alloscardovia macacae]|uniref:ABC transporter permease n=2 Tax=Alloscardovia macacae TaxID=1160091 RepID=A0A1Y2SZH6_9BIFI|nr:ABC transporter permease [Alloscardovia macacae]OTA29851.1 ABC transporter permease [Alloscardovia macacae]